MIFLALPILFVPLVYGLSSTPDACAVPPDPDRGGACQALEGTTFPANECCWLEDVEPGTGNPEFGGNYEMYCQTCYQLSTGIECDEKELQYMTTPPTTGEGVLPGTAEQPPTPAPPPLFGRNDATVPPTGGVEQPPTTPPRLPGGGANVPPQGGGIGAEQPQTPPTPLPPPPQTGPSVAPEDNQDESNGEGRPPLKSDESPPFGEGGGEAVQPSDDGQNPTIIE